MKLAHLAFLGLIALLVVPQHCFMAAADAISKLNGRYGSPCTKKSKICLDISDGTFSLHLATYTDGSCSTPLFSTHTTGSWQDQGLTSDLKFRKLTTQAKYVDYLIHDQTQASQFNTNCKCGGTWQAGVTRTFVSECPDNSCSTSPFVTFAPLFALFTTSDDAQSLNLTTQPSSRSSEIGWNPAGFEPQPLQRVSTCSAVSTHFPDAIPSVPVRLSQTPTFIAASCPSTYVTDYPACQYQYHCMYRNPSTGAVMVQGTFRNRGYFSGVVDPLTRKATLQTYDAQHGAGAGSTVYAADWLSSTDTQATNPASSAFTLQAGAQDLVNDAWERCLLVDDHSDAAMASHSPVGVWDSIKQDNMYLCFDNNKFTGSYQFHLMDVNKMEYGEMQATGWGFGSYKKHLHGTWSATGGPYAGESGPMFGRFNLAMDPPRYKGWWCLEDAEICYTEDYKLIEAIEYASNCKSYPVPTVAAAKSDDGGSSRTAVGLIVYLVIFSIAVVGAIVFLERRTSAGAGRGGLPPAASYQEL